MFARTALLILGFVLAGTMSAAGAAGTCITSPDRDETLTVRDGTYLYLVSPAGAAHTDVFRVGVWQEANGISGLQTGACHDASGVKHYGEDRKVGSLLA